MPENSSLINTDILIIGGGIAGLWAMHTLSQQGYKVLLLENTALGAGQTIKSQGIIHGGLKYALSGNLNAASEALSDMPRYWQQCLNGQGPVDLTQVPILSYNQYMWSINKFTGGINSLFASAAMRSQVTTIKRDAMPELLKNSAIQGNLYKLAELVLNVPALIRALSAPIIDSCFKIQDLKLELNSTQEINKAIVTIDQQQVTIKAQRYIFTAGAGNEQILNNLTPGPNMQRRALHMVIAKSANLPPLFGHCVGFKTIPRITITTHVAHDHQPVWYLGGKLAEDGVSLSSEQQIKIAQKELASIFPNLNLKDITWASFFVDRAEQYQQDGKKPNTCSLIQNKNYLCAWPTKLALAPVLSQEILHCLQSQNLSPNLNLGREDILDQLPQPPIATPIWDELL